MDEPTKEQEQWFWEQCGFRYEETTKQVCGEVSKCYMWRYPDGSWHERLLPIDPNNLLRYAVPKLLGEDNPSNNHSAYNILSAWLRRVVYNREDPALTLFWPIYKALE